MAYTIKRDMEDAMKFNILISMLTGSCSLIGLLTKSSTTCEKRLMIETVKDANKSSEVNDVVFIRSKHDITDSFTNIESHSALLYTL